MELKCFEHEFCILTPQSSNQNTVFVGYIILIGWGVFSSARIKIILESFMSARPDFTFILLFQLQDFESRRIC